MNRKQAFLLWFICLMAIPAIVLMQFFEAVLGSVKRSVHIAIGIDQTINVLLGGMPDETISARVHRCGWKRTEKLINGLFGDSTHCQCAYESEVLQRHLPNEYRSG